MFDLNFINSLVMIFQGMTEILQPKYVSRHQNVIQKRKNLTFAEMEYVGSMENDNEFHICKYVMKTYLDYFGVKMSNFFINCHKYRRNIASSLF
jgi:hypothetical protein